LLVNRMVVSFHGGSPFKVLSPRFYSESGGTAASTSNYGWDAVAVCGKDGNRLAGSVYLQPSGAHRNGWSRIKETNSCLLFLDRFRGL
jgi:hypothetical protein